MAFTGWMKLPMAGVVVSGVLMTGVGCEPAARRERVEGTEGSEIDRSRERANDMGEGARELGQETMEGARDLGDEVGDSARDLQRDMD